MTVDLCCNEIRPPLKKGVSHDLGARAGVRGLVIFKRVNMDARNSVWPQFLAADDYEDIYVFLGGEYTSFPAKEIASFGIR